MKPLWWLDRVSSDTRLSCSARWLLGWLGMRPAGWRYSVEEAQTAAACGRQKFQGMMAELKAIGYVETAYKRDRFGRIKFTKLILRDTTPEGGKSCLRAGAHRKSGSKASGPEGGFSAQTSKKNHTSEKEVAASLRIVGGRDA